MLFFGYPYGGKHAARRELSMCILYGNTVVWCIDTLKLRMSPGRHSKIPSQQGLWRHSKFKNQNFGKLVSVLSFVGSLYIIYIYNIHIYIYTHLTVHSLSTEVMAFPLGLMATMAGREVWLTGDRFMEYGYISDPLVSEVRGWPGTRWRPLVIGKGFTSGIGWGLRKHEFMIIYRDSKGLKPQTHGGIDGWLNWEVLHGDILPHLLIVITNDRIPINQPLYWDVNRVILHGSFELWLRNSPTRVPLNVMLLVLKSIDIYNKPYY